MTPFVSIIIPHRNDSTKLSLCLKALKIQTYPKNLYEIIVVDNCSDNLHLEKLQKLTNCYDLKLLTESKLSSYAARNLGLLHSKADYIAFTDADCIPNDNWIENGVKGLLDSKNHIIGGNIELFFNDINNPNTVELYEKIYSFRQSRNIENNYTATANMFTLKKIINKIGNFKQDMKSNGDKEWGLRANDKGFNIKYCDDVVVRHPARHKFLDFIKRQIRLAGGGYTLSKERGISSIQTFCYNTLHLIPPFVSIYRTILIDDYKNIKSSSKKIKVLLLFILVRYLKVFEIYKLLLGFSPKNY